MLSKLGLDETLLARGARVERLFGQTGAGRTVLDVRYRTLGCRGGFGVGVLARQALPGDERAVQACPHRQTEW